MREEQLLSVGIDIGTSTTQCVFSLLTLSNTASAFSVPRIRITEKKILYRAPLVLTPLLNSDTIDAPALETIVREAYRLAGISPTEIRLGAVIITGETARKANARAVTEAPSQLAGDFVVATAGPSLESILAGRGSGAADLSVHRGRRVLNLDIGGGTTDISVISLCEPVVDASLKVAGDKFDEAIIKHVRKRHNILIGEKTAEKLKIEIGCAYPRDEELTLDVQGRNIITGLPSTVTVSSTEMLEALEEPITQIFEAVHNVLERTPPELMADISQRGIVMTGGGAMLYGLDHMLSNRIGIDVYLAQDPVSCVVIGTGKALDMMDKFAALSSDV